MVDTFNYGHTFQLKLIASLLTDINFLKVMAEKLQYTYFDSDACRWLSKMIVEYFKKYSVAPTLDVFKIELDSIDDENKKISIIETLRETIKYYESDELSFIKDKTKEFCISQGIKNTLIDAPDYLEAGKLTELKDRFDGAFNVDFDEDFGHNYAEDFDERYDEPPRNTSNTPWDIINDITDGGLGGGELGIIAAPSGAGKSWALVSLAAHHIKNGGNVIYFTMELKHKYVGCRFDSLFSGIAPNNLKYHKEDIKKIVDSIKGKLLIKYYAANTATINTFNTFIERSKLNGLNSTMVIIDYPDLAKNSVQLVRNDLNLGNIYTDCRGLAGIHDIPVWAASQTQRSSLEMDVIGAEKIAEAYSKIMVADLVISLSRKITDKIAGTGRWHIIKNRFGPDGITFPSKINTATGEIKIYEDNTIEGKQMKSKMDNENEYMRRFLAKKHKEFEDSPSLEDNVTDADINDLKDTDDFVPPDEYKTKYSGGDDFE